MLTKMIHSSISKQVEKVSSNIVDWLPLTIADDIWIKRHDKKIEDK